MRILCSKKIGGKRSMWLSKVFKWVWIIFDALFLRTQWGNTGSYIICELNSVLFQPGLDINYFYLLSYCLFPFDQSTKSRKFAWEQSRSTVRKGLGRLVLLLLPGSGGLPPSPTILYRVIHLTIVVVMYPQRCHCVLRRRRKHVACPGYKWDLTVVIRPPGKGGHRGQVYKGPALFTRRACTFKRD